MRQQLFAEYRPGTLSSQGPSYFLLTILLISALLVLIGFTGIKITEFLQDPKLLQSGANTPYGGLWQQVLLFVAWLNESHTHPNYSDLLLLFTLGLAYLLPAVVADVRRHTDRKFIIALNVFLGWTGFGWLAAFVWSLLPRRGLRSLGKELVTSTEPFMRSGSERLGKELRPLVREVTTKLDAATGGRLRAYEPPLEGVASLIERIALRRNAEGHIELRLRVLLPIGTQIKVSVSPEAAPDEFTYTARISIGNELWIAGISRHGRPWPEGVYRIVIRADFEHGVQDDHVVAATGENGVKLPHSATQPADPEFPHHARVLHEELKLTFPPVDQATKAIEAVKLAKLHVQSKGDSSRYVEEIVRLRFQSVADDALIDEPWRAERSGDRVWTVRLHYAKQGKTVVAEWSYEEEGSGVKYLNPNAKALSFG
ncbi:superinfection immunity protein [Skermanella sp. TT6]|uniref:Superinfection immunity protein n=1 Tax=Skermanella cutis TaxID=2775420 RepID=A0ABX7AZN9_9PROT|nr:superinfection immunity protein [Skermanella sp. TT6]QQP87545.1 superinfection immunity protein [Skermanella sp. TT6]